MLDRLRYMARLAKLASAAIGLRPAGRLTVADRIEDAARRHPADPFVHFEDRSLSYGQWNEAANRVAHWGLHEGLGSGDVVALLMENRPEYLCMWAGLAKIGVTAALINANLAGRALRHALDTSSAHTVIVGAECLDMLIQAEPAGSPCVFVSHEPGAPHARLPTGIEDLDPVLESMPSTNPPAGVRRNVHTGDDLFYIYTSGTTGNPKAARFSHLRFLGVGMVNVGVGEFGPDDVIYCALPLYHSAGGVVVVSEALACGASIALRRRFSASGFWDDVRRYDATAFHYIGEFCRYLLNQPEDSRDRTHRIRVAIGNGLRPDIWERFQDRFGIPKIREFYGATEGNVPLLNLDGKVGSVGRIPFKFLLSARLIRYDVDADEHRRGPDGFCVECDTDEPGELIGRISDLAGRFEGYTSEEATEKKVLRDVFKQGDAWFRTGDLLRCDAEGYYYFVDRIGDTFRWKGENVSTQEVAEVLGDLPGLEMVNVYGVEVPEADGRAGMAALCLQNVADFDPKAFYELVSDRLPRYATPVFLRLQAELEITGTFKMRKIELQKQGFDPEACGEPVLVRDDGSRTYVPLTPERLAEIQAGDHRL